MCTAVAFGAWQRGHVEVRVRVSVIPRLNQRPFVLLPQPNPSPLSCLVCLFILHITQLTPHKLIAEHKNCTSADGASSGQKTKVCIECAYLLSFSCSRCVRRWPLGLGSGARWKLKLKLESTEINSRALHSCAPTHTDKPFLFFSVPCSRCVLRWPWGRGSEARWRSGLGLGLFQDDCSPRDFRSSAPTLNPNPFRF